MLKRSSKIKSVDKTPGLSVTQSKDPISSYVSSLFQIPMNRVKGKIKINQQKSEATIKNIYINNPQQRFSNAFYVLWDSAFNKLIGKSPIKINIFLHIKKLAFHRFMALVESRLYFKTPLEAANFQLNHHHNFQIKSQDGTSLKLSLKNQCQMEIPIQLLYPPKLEKPLKIHENQLKTLFHLFEQSPIHVLQKIWDLKGREIMNSLYLFFNFSSQFQDIQKILLVIQIRIFKKERMYETMLKGINQTAANLLKHFQLPSTEVLLERFIRRHRPAERGTQLIDLFKSDLKQKNEIDIPKDIQLKDIILSARTKEVKRQMQNRVQFQIEVNQQEKMTIKDYIARDLELYQGRPIIFDFLERLKTRRKKEGFRNLEDILDYRCLSCCFYFQLYRNINMDHMGQTPFYCFEEVKKLTIESKQLKKMIISLMNSSGGIILYDVKRAYREVFPLGTILREEKKESIKQEIYKIVKNIKFFGSETIRPGSLVEVDFVPVKQAISRRDVVVERISEKNIDEEGFIQGLYVTRIKVCPTDSTSVAYTEQEDKVKSYYNQPKGPILTVHPASFRKFMKKKIKYFHPKSAHLTAQKAQNYFSHVCTFPQKGFPLTINPIESLYKSIIETEQRFQHMSMLVCKDSHMKLIRQTLELNNIVEYKLERLFKDIHFQEAKYNAILYHNFPKKQDLNLLFEDLTLGKDRKIIFVEVTKSLQLRQRSKSSPLSKEELMNIKDLFNKEIPFQRFKLFESYERKGNEQKEVHYIVTETKTAALYLYYLLNHFKIKALMIPLENKQTIQDRQKRLIYSS